MRECLKVDTKHWSKEQFLLSLLHACLDDLSSATEECHEVFEACQDYLPRLAYYVPHRLISLLESASQLKLQAESELGSDLKQFSEGHVAKSTLDACFARLRKSLAEQICKLCDELRPLMVGLDGAISVCLDKSSPAQRNHLKDCGSSLVGAAEHFRENWNAYFPDQQFAEEISIGV
jgi:hypothetical protein